MKKIAAIILSAMAAAAPAFGQSKLSPYTLHSLKKATLPAIRQTAASDADAPRLLNAYLHASRQLDRKQLERLSIKVNVDLGDLLTIQLPDTSLTALAALEGVGYVQAATPVRPMMDLARAAAGADLVATGNGLSQAYAGSGIVVGVIDAGFDYTHPNFYDAAGQSLRIKRVWEQKYSGGTPPQGFSYGSEFTSPEAILAAGGDVTTNSHGTHVAGIAAGAYESADVPWRGIAAEADIVLVSMGEAQENNVNISDAIAYIYQYAEQEGKPCVINMSLGQQIGPHDGTSAFDRLADRLQGAGRLLVGSSGNFGTSKIHVSKVFSGAGDGDLRTLVSYKSTPSAINCGGEVDIWGTEGMKYDVQVVVYNYSRNEIVDATQAMDASLPEGATQEYTFSSSAAGTVLLTTEINPLNGKPHTLVSLALRSLRYNHAVGIIVTPRSAGEVHAWADDTYVQFTNRDLEGWQDGDTRHTLAEIGGTGTQIISVGAYATRTSYVTAGSSREQSTGETLGDIATFSSTGNALDGRMKPDVAAPGTFIASSVSSHDAGLSSYPLAGTTEWNGKTYSYAYMQGTSMAAPFVTGVVATWLQANPDLTPDDIRDVLRETSVHDEFTDGAASPGSSSWGYGKINAYDGLKACLLLASGIERATTAASPAAKATILQSTGAGGHSLLFTRSADKATVSIYGMSGQLLQARQLHGLRAGDEVQLPASGLPAGAYMVHVAADGFSESHKCILR